MHSRSMPCTQSDIPTDSKRVAHSFHSSGNICEGCCVCKHLEFSCRMSRATKCTIIAAALGTTQSQFDSIISRVQKSIDMNKTVECCLRDRRKDKISNKIVPCTWNFLKGDDYTSLNSNQGMHKVRLEWPPSQPRSDQWPLPLTPQTRPPKARP